MFWGHLDGTRTIRKQMLRTKGTLSSPLWNTCVQSDNDTETHFAHTLKKTQEDRKYILELSVSGWPWQHAQWLMGVPLGSNSGNHWGLSCDLLGYLLNDMFRYVHALVRQTTPKLENLDEIFVYQTVVTIRCHFYIPLFKVKQVN